MIRMHLLTKRIWPIVLSFLVFWIALLLLERWFAVRTASIGIEVTAASDVWGLVLPALSRSLPVSLSAILLATAIFWIGLRVYERRLRLYSSKSLPKMMLQAGFLAIPILPAVILTDLIMFTLLRIGQGALVSELWINLEVVYSSAFFLFATILLSLMLVAFSWRTVTNEVTRWPQLKGAYQLAWQFGRLFSIVLPQMSAVLGGLFVLELIFRGPGIGKLFGDAHQAFDWPILVVILQSVALLILLTHLLAELLNYLLGHYAAMSYVVHGEKLVQVAFSKVAKASLGLAIAVTALIAVGRTFAPDPTMFSADERRLSFSLAHPFGTDNTGRDMFARILMALSNDLMILVAVVIVISILVVLLARFRSGGWIQMWLKASVRPLHFVPIIPAVWFCWTIINYLPPSWHSVPFVDDNLFYQIIIYLVLTILLVSRVSPLIVRIMAEPGLKRREQRNALVATVSYMACFFTIHSLALLFHNLVPRVGSQIALGYELLQVRQIWMLAPAASIIVMIILLMIATLLLIANLFEASSSVRISLSEINR